MIPKRGTRFSEKDHAQALRKGSHPDTIQMEQLWAGST
jgi:hypothetical protein